MAGILPTSASAFPGQLDPSFGQHGIATSKLEPHFGETRFEAIAEEPNGALLAARPDKTRRYSHDGVLDTSFAPRKSRFPEIPVKATEPDGKTIVTVEYRKLQRLNPDGSPDPTFNGGQSVEPPLREIDRILLMPSGKILIAGSSVLFEGAKGTTTQVGLVRLNPDGSLDQGFGKAGLVNLQSEEGVISSYPEAQGLVLQSEESVAVITSEQVVKLGPDGRLDPRYGSGGVAALAAANLVAFRALPGDKIALAGDTATRVCCDTGSFFYAQLGPDGRLDPAFAAGKGIATADPGGSDRAEAVLWEADGSVLLGGTATVPGCTQADSCLIEPALVHFTPAGNPDPDFGAAGLVRIDAVGPGSSSRGVVAMIPRRGGGVIAAGGGGPEESVAFLAALSGGGALDKSFGTGGVVEERNPEASAQNAGPVTVAANGKIFAAADITAGVGYGAGVIRFKANGVLDRSYGGGSGYVKAQETEAVQAIALDRAGGAVLLSRYARVTRFTPAGKIDRRFSQGANYVSLEAGSAHYRAVTVQSDGKVLVAGTDDWLGTHGHMLVARLLPSGRPDPSFGDKGFAKIGCRQRGRCGATAIVLQRDGRILLAGRVQGNGRGRGRYSEEPSRLALARLLPSGRPDRGFARAGFTSKRIGPHSQATALAISKRGIFLTGWARSPHGPRGLLACYRFNGSLDRRFGRTGILITLPPQAGIPTTVLPARDRIALLTEGPSRYALAYRLDGRPERSYARKLRGIKPLRGSRPMGATQGGTVIVAWSGKRQVKLARLSGN